MINIIYKSIIFCVLMSLKTLSSNAQTEYLVTVEPSNAAITKIDSIPGVTWLRPYNIPTYCENKRQYTFIGGDDPGGNPFYLFTIDATSGSTISNPLFANHNSFLNLQYSGTGTILYGTIWNSPIASLVSVNPTTATYSIIRNIPNLSSVSKLIVDELHNRFIILGPDNIGNLTLMTMDISNGNVISQVPTPKINNLVYNKLTDKFYAISNRNGIPPNNPYIFSISSIDPNTGTILNIADIPNLAGLTSGSETLDEKHGLYFFAGFEWNYTSNFLYTIDISNGTIIHKPSIHMKGTIDEDNLVEFRFDNNIEKLYALFWEAKTIIPPSSTIDSTCRLGNETKIYPNPFNKSLFVNKKVTTCQVFMNIYNTLGQLIVKDMKIKDGLNEITLSNLSAGVYYYKFVSNGNTLLSGKVMKQ